MAGTLAFSRIVIKDIFRNRGRTLSSIIGVVLAVSLITGENIALDTTARDVLKEELLDYEYDFVGSSEEDFTKEEIEKISEEIRSIKGITDVVTLTQTAVQMEIHSEKTILPPKYGFYEKSYDINVPIDGSVWLNAELEPIPYKTYKVFGHVHSQYDGNPLDNITVEAREGSEGAFGYSESTYTDQNGYYEFFLPLAKFTIRTIIENISQDFYSEKVQRTEINVSTNHLENQVDFNIYDRETSELYGDIFELESGELYDESIFIRFKNEIEHENYTTEYYFRLSTRNSSYRIFLVPGMYRIEMDPWKWNIVTNFVNIDAMENSSQMLNLSVYKIVETDVTIEGFVKNEVTQEPVPFYIDVMIVGIDQPYINMTELDDNGYFKMDVVSGNISIYVHDSNQFLDEEFILFNQPGDKVQHDVNLTPLTSWLDGSLTSTNGGVIYDAVFLLEGENYLRGIPYSSYLDIDLPPGNYTITFDARPNDIPVFHDNPELTFYEITETSDKMNIFADEIGYEIQNGSFEVDTGEVVITDYIADQFNLDVDEEIYFLIRGEEWDNETHTYIPKLYTWTYNVTGIVGTLDFLSNRMYRIGNPYSIFMNESDFADFQLSVSDLNEHSFKNTRFYIKIDRDKIIDPLSRDSTEYILLRLLTKVNSVTWNNYNLHVDNIIDRPLNRYYTWFESYRLEMLAYSLPVIAVGFYLGMVGIELATAQKRRTLGIIKSRGASDKQVFYSLILESVILGFIAGTIGLILGVFVSRIFLTIIPGARNMPSDVDFLRLNISSTSILWGILFAVSLLVLASIRPAKRISKSPIIESIHQDTELGKKKEYKPGLDIFLVSFAVFAFIVVSEINLNEIDPSELGQIFTVLLFVIYVGSVIWLPFSPFFLMFSLTRLLTRGTSRVYKFFSRAVKPFSKDLWYIIHKNLSRSPKKVSMVSIIIALALGFGVFMTIMIGTTINGQVLETRAKIGGDLYLKTQSVNSSFEIELYNISGVNGVVPVNWIYGHMISGDEFVSYEIAVFNASEYRDHVEVNDYFFIEGSPKEALKSLAKGNSVIVGESLAQLYSLSIGDMIRIQDPYFPFATSDRDDIDDTGLELKNDLFKVVGIVRALPGLEISFEEFDYDEWGRKVYMDLSGVKTNFSEENAGWSFLVDIEGNAEVVESAIWGNLSSNILDIKNLQTEIDGINDDPSSNSVLYLMLVNIGFMIIIITVGLGLIMFISIGERRNEFATIMARGAEGKQMVVLILGEALSITMVGAVVGFFSGLFTAYTFNKMLSANTLFGISGTTLSDRPLVIPWYALIMVILALLALFLTSIIAAYRVKKIKLHSALRIRGG